MQDKRQFKGLGPGGQIPGPPLSAMLMVTGRFKVDVANTKDVNVVLAMKKRLARCSGPEALSSSSASSLAFDEVMNGVVGSSAASAIDSG